MLATLKNRVRAGDAHSPVLTSPQEMLVLIGSSQQMVLEVRWLCKESIITKPTPSLRCLQKLSSVFSRSQTPVQIPGMAIRDWVPGQLGHTPTV